jgi:predicted HAD superfamily phosphohydrolase YqeG
MVAEPPQLGTARGGLVLPCSDITSFTSWLTSHPNVETVLVDVENTIAPYTPTKTQLAQSLRMAIKELEQVESLKRVWFLSNSSLVRVDTPTSRLEVRVVPRAGKPLLRRSLLSEIDLDRGHLAVWGDQPLTDGLLARRLGATFLYQSARMAGEPAWPRLLRFMGQRLMLPRSAPSDAHQQPSEPEHTADDAIKTMWAE